MNYTLYFVHLENCNKVTEITRFEKISITYIHNVQVLTAYPVGRYQLSFDELYIPT